MRIVRAFAFFLAENKKIPKRGKIFCKSKCLTQLLSLLCLSFANRSTKQTKATNGKKRTNRNNESPWRKYFTFTPLQLLPQERRDLAKSPCRPPTGLPVSNCCSSPRLSTIALRLVNATILQFCNSHLPWHRLNCLQFSFQLLGKLSSFLQFCNQFSFSLFLLLGHRIKFIWALKQINYTEATSAQSDTKGHPAECTTSNRMWLKGSSVCLLLIRSTN